MSREFKAPQAYSDEEYVPIPMTPVVSNQVAKVGYSLERKTLAVTFTRGAGAIYQYPNVEPETDAVFISAESIGKFFGQHIQPLPFKKFPPEPEASTQSTTQTPPTGPQGAIAQTPAEVVDLAEHAMTTEDASS